MTETKQREEMLRRKAQRDPLTGIGNRAFFLEKAEDMLEKEVSMVFCIVLQNCPLQAAKDKLQVIQNAFESEKTHEYPKSFSCGMVEVPKDHEELDIVKIIEEADAVMYLQKKKHRQSQLELQRKE